VTLPYAPRYSGRFGFGSFWSNPSNSRSQRLSLGPAAAHPSSLTHASSAKSRKVLIRKMRAVREDSPSSLCISGCRMPSANLAPALLLSAHPGQWDRSCAERTYGTGIRPAAAAAGGCKYDGGAARRFSGAGVSWW
jgi:hypothetical protein